MPSRRDHVIGALIIGVMKNGLDILNVSADFQQVARAQLKNSMLFLSADARASRLIRCTSAENGSKEMEPS